MTVTSKLIKNFAVNQLLEAQAMLRKEIHKVSTITRVLYVIPTESREKRRYIIGHDR